MVRSTVATMATVAATLASVGAWQPAAPPMPDWSGFAFLIGDFTAVGDGTPGAATGSTSMRPVMGGTALERINRADYPAANGRPAFKHEDRLYLYRDPGAGGIRGLYFDGEGHVILYRVSVDNSARRVEMVSDVIPGQPRYRFVYTSDAPDEFDATFEIAPPDHPDQFTRYVGGKARRVPRAGPPPGR